MFYPVGSDHVLQERGASDFSPVWKGIFKRGTMPITKKNLKNTLQSGCLTLDPFPPISLRYKRHPLPSPFMLQQFSDAAFTPKRPLFGGGTMTQAGSGQYEKVIACYRNNSMQNFFALPLVHHPGPLRALRVGLWGYPGPWGNPESQTGGRFPSAYTKHGSI